VAAISVEAWKLISFSIITILDNGFKLSWSMVSDFLFNYNCLDSWLQAQLKLGSFFCFSIITDLVGGCKLGWSLFAVNFSNFQSLGWWLQAQLKLGSLFFFQLLQTWFVAASSDEAW
jgi:hypothetical protein